MEMRGDDPELANSLRIDERELEAGGSASGKRRSIAIPNFERGSRKAEPAAKRCRAHLRRLGILAAD